MRLPCSSNVLLLHLTWNFILICLVLFWFLFTKYLGSQALQQFYLRRVILLSKRNNGKKLSISILRPSNFVEKMQHTTVTGLLLTWNRGGNCFITSLLFIIACACSFSIMSDKWRCKGWAVVRAVFHLAYLRFRSILAYLSVITSNIQASIQSLNQR